MQRARWSSFAAVALVLSAFVALQAQTGPASGYLTPPKVIVDLLDAPPTPGVIVDPTYKVMALVERRSMPTLADLSQPIYRLAGARINPATSGPQQRAGATVAITLRPLAGGAETKVVVPASPRLGGVGFSPNGKLLSFTQTRSNGIDLYVADVTTGQSRLLVSGLNATTSGCDWLENSSGLLCHLVPANRGAEPKAPAVPSGPNIQETAGRAAPAATYEDLLKNEQDEVLFAHYFTSQLAIIDAAKGAKTLVGAPAIFDDAALSPNGEHLLVAKVKRPFSRLLPMGGFPKDVEIWNRKGEVVRKVADVPSGEGVPINGVLTGPRQWRWRQDQPATVVWAEALDGGNPRTQAPFRDKVMTLAAPFAGEPAELAKTQFRYAGVSWTEKGTALLSESDRATRTTRTWLLDAGAEPRKLWDRKQEDRYGDPGSPLLKRGGGGGGFGGFGGGGGGSPILQNGEYIYLSGAGASPEGDRPFLDRLSLKTLQSERLFRCDAGSYESVVMPLTPDARTLLTRFETKTDPPNYFVRDLNAGTKKAVTSFADPQPQIRGVQSQFVTYERKDGIKLSATLYLPPNYQSGQKLPVVMWAYPREFTDPNAAGQVTGSPHRFTTMGGASHLLLLTQGYAIFDNPTMPIIGPGETANDTYVDQLVASAQAAVDKVVALGVGDRARIGVGGHSYGAFMTANLLAHSDLFRAGIARSGAYNRSLTPFGFQNERRTFWEVPEIYARMSPFWFANQVNEPILLTHGEMDDNSGTFPIQSERLYMALKGHGATVRYVTLPYEAHGYAARESVLHTVAEMLNWMDKWVKGAK